MAKGKGGKGRKGPAKKQKKVVIGTPQELREKLQAAASKRHRVPKGQTGAGRFASEGGAKGKVGHIPDKYKPGMVRPSERIGGSPKNIPFGTSGSHTREQMSIHRAENRTKSRRQLERDAAYYKTRTLTGASQVPAPDRDEADVRVTHHDIHKAEMARKESSWKTQPGLYGHGGATKRKRTGRPDQYVPPTKFINQHLAPSHKKWVSKALGDRGSVFNQGLSPRQTSPSGKAKLAPAQRHRLESYTRMLQEGKSHNEAVTSLSQERRGRKPATQKPERTSGARTKDVEKTFEDRQQRQGLKDKYQSLTPKPGEINVGIEAQHINSVSQLEDMFPNMSDRDVIRLQQGQRKSMYDQFQTNARWVQETRTSNVTNGKGDTGNDNNRVVFFTTSVGHPAPSVPANSLVGQYIIRRRKNMLLKEGIAKPRDIAGNFPDAVRDMHVVEASTGYSLGAEGNVGAFKRNGWRVGTKKSTGFGKPVPVGSQIVTDSQGRPVYDENGNVRWGEGATRKFAVGTNKDLGFRVFLG